MNFAYTSRKALLAATALAAIFGFAVSAQAQTCTVTNWDAHPNLDDGADNASGDVGTQPNGFKRYGGPCGLRVPFGAAAAYVENSTQGGDGSTPLDEPYYVTRFYTFLGDVTTSGGAAIFTAFDDADAEVFSVLYDSDTSEISFNVPGATSPTPEPVDAGMWHSVEIVYDATGDEFIFSIDRALDEDEDGTIDSHATIVTGTFDANVAVAQLGNIDGVGSGDAYFDDFDSRRTSFPGRLLLGDADANDVVDLLDALSIRDEFFDGVSAAGQPDCDENGEIDLLDALCARDIFFN